MQVPGISEQPVFDCLVRAPPGKEAGRLRPVVPVGNFFSGSYFGLRIQRYLATMPVHVKILIYQYFEPYLLPGLSGHGARSTVE